MKKVSIVPSTCYCNGRQVLATSFNVVSVSDNLFDRVVFKYTLFDASGAFGGEAAYELSGIDSYKTWDSTPEGAYTIVANALGLVLVEAEASKLFELPIDAR